MCSSLCRIACQQAGLTRQTLIQQTSSPSGMMNGSQLRWSIPRYWITHYPATRIQSILTPPGTSKSLLDQLTPVCILSKEVEPCTTDTCPCSKRQGMSHIVNSCPQTKLEGGLQRLHSADDVATERLKIYGL